MITGVDENTVNPELIAGEYLFAIEPRTLEHIRALGGNDAEDDLRFATAARVSEINRGLYETFLRPAIRASVTEQSAELSRAMHQHRLQYEMFSDRIRSCSRSPAGPSPCVQTVIRLARTIRFLRSSTLYPIRSRARSICGPMHGT